MECNYCGNAAQLVTGRDIYPKRKDLHARLFYSCKRCGAWVGCHPDTDKALGFLANKELRQARMKAHKYFDQIHYSGYYNRSDAYYWLSRQLGIKVKNCHISQLNLKQLETVVIVSKGLLKAIRKKRLEEK